MKNKKPTPVFDMEKSVQITEISDKMCDFVTKIIEENPDMDISVIMSSVLTTYSRLEYEISRSSGGSSSKVFHNIVKKAYRGIQIPETVSDE